MLGDAGIFVAWKILFGLSVCDIRMDSSDRKEISHCDIARQKAVRPRFPAFVRKATVFTVPLTLSDKNCQRYATSAKHAQGLCLPIATLFADVAGVGKRQVGAAWHPHSGWGILRGAIRSFDATVALSVKPCSRLPEGDLDFTSVGFNQPLEKPFR